MIFSSVVLKFMVLDEEDFIMPAYFTDHVAPEGRPCSMKLLVQLYTEEKVIDWLLPVARLPLTIFGV